MEYVHAALLVNEANEELNETNLTAVLEAAGCDVAESRTKALVAALEGVDVDRIDAAAVDRIGAPENGDSAEATGSEVDAPEGDANGASDADASFTETPFTETPFTETPFTEAGVDADPSGADGDRSDDASDTVE